MTQMLSIVSENSLNVDLIFCWFISNIFNSFELASTIEPFLHWFPVIRNLFYLVSQKIWRTSFFTTAIRGFHYYREFWKPIENEKLKFLFEDNNPYKTVTSNWQIISDLHIEVLSVTTYFCDHRVVMQIEFF